MPKYLFSGSYTLDGVRGLLKDGGSRRQAAAKRAIESVGGKLEAFYFTFGGGDVVGIADVPNNVSMAGLSLAISSGGGFGLKTTVLLTPRDIDRAVKKAVKYRAPGK